jgi:hypothetical protein
MRMVVNGLDLIDLRQQLRIRRLGVKNGNNE